MTSYGNKLQVKKNHFFHSIKFKKTLSNTDDDDDEDWTVLNSIKEWTVICI